MTRSEGISGWVRKVLVTRSEGISDSIRRWVRKVLVTRSEGGSGRY